MNIENDRDFFELEENIPDEIDLMEDYELNELEGNESELEAISAYEVGTLGELENVNDEYENDEQWQEDLEITSEGEDEYGFEGDFGGENTDEEFFGFIKKIGRGLGGLIKKGARALSKVVGPLLKKLGPIAARIVGGAVGGPAGAAIGGTIASAILREGEADTESEADTEAEFERSDYEFVESGGDSESYEAMQEYARDMAEADSEQRTNRSFVAMAQQAARMFRRNRRLKPVIPLVLRGALALVKTFRANRNTRWAIRAIPLIIRRTLTRLARVRKITRKAVVVSMARETAWVLANRRRATLAMRPGSRPKRMGRQRPRSRRPIRAREALDY